MTTKSGRVALFGGSFDPPHAGHLEVATAAMKRCDFERVIFLPCHRSPHKKHCTEATGFQRIEMLKLLTARLRWAEVSEFEVVQPPPSFTWITAEYFASKESQESKIFWILGADQWQNITRWEKSKRLAELLHFIVVAREGYKIQNLAGYDATPIEVAHPASSTELRRLIAHGFPPTEGWLPETLLEYIHDHSLYGSHNG